MFIASSVDFSTFIRCSESFAKHVTNDIRNCTIRAIVCDDDVRFVCSPFDNKYIVIDAHESIDVLCAYDATTNEQIMIDFCNDDESFVVAKFATCDACMRDMIDYIAQHNN